MNYRAELNRRKYWKQLAAAASQPAAALNLWNLNLWKLILAMILFLGVTFVAIPYGLSYLQSTTNQLNQQADGDDLQVTQLIQKVEDQLVASEKIRLSKHRAALFRVKSFDLELNFVVKQDAWQKGSTSYSLVTVDNQIDASTEMTQTLTLHMEVPPSQHEIIVDPAPSPPVGPITPIGPGPSQIGGAGWNSPGKTHEKPH